jgi:hypothetical protein
MESDAALLQGTDLVDDVRTLYMFIGTLHELGTGSCLPCGKELFRVRVSSLFQETIGEGQNGLSVAVVLFQCIEGGALKDVCKLLHIADVRTASKWSCK